MMVSWLPVGPESTCRTLSSSITCLHAAMFSFMIIKDWASEIVSYPPQLNIFIYELPWSWRLLAAIVNPKRLPLLIMSQILGFLFCYECMVFSQILYTRLFLFFVYCELFCNQHGSLHSYTLISFFWGHLDVAVS